MSWAIGYDDHWQRDIGYGVPAICDHPRCSKEIDRGLSYVCGGEPYGGEKGCGLYFCGGDLDCDSLCSRCRHRKRPFAAKPDTREWINHKLTDESWQRWRDENPDAVLALCREVSRMTDSRRATKGWEPISTAPKDQAVLGGWHNRYYGWIWGRAQHFTDPYFPDGYWVMLSGGTPTHWLPLPPAPPETEAGE